MRLASFHGGAGPSYGACLDGGVVDLGRRLGAGRRTLRELLVANDRRPGLLDEVETLAAASGPDAGPDDIRYLPTVPDVQKIICIGVNYHDRDAVYAWDHVAGLTLMNDGSARDWLRHGKFNVTQGKNFEGSGALGPWMVTTDELAEGEALHLTTRVNGELRQRDSTANLRFGFAYLISYLSTFLRLKPGDLIATGTPAGAGVRFDPPRYLQAGDVVEVSVAQIGTLSNAVEDERGV
ncbi:MAG: fumarylacetoacetate hydrolase family protein [Rhodospirillaceae bacterium]|nr:fumarylacetoacetate hydrolase family protein [Rhodospirillaceae bacterium]